MVEKHFELSDSNRDGQLDSREWLGYMREEDHHLKRDKATRSLRYILDQDCLPRPKDDFQTLCSRVDLI